MNFSPRNNSKGKDSNLGSGPARDRETPNSAQQPTPEVPQNGPVEGFDLSKIEIVRNLSVTSSLSSAEIEGFRQETARVVGRSSRISSLLTLPVTAFGYFLLDKGGSLPSLIDTVKIILPTAVLWYGSYFSQVERWKKHRIKETPKIQQFFSEKHIKANVKIFFAADAMWYASRGLGDPLFIAATGAVIGASNTSAALGGFCSHLFLAFFIFPKYGLPFLHRKLDESKKSSKET